MTRPLLSGAAALALCAATMTAAQAPPPGTPQPDGPEIRQRIEALRGTAGAEWSEAVDFICALNPNRANRPDDPELEPTRVFDNLAVVGRSGTAVWIVTTSAGLVLIDAGYEDQLDSVLLKGMKTLGLDPARVTYVIVGHGHGDHFGGASYFQQRGARVVMGAPDWDLLQGPATPKRDISVTDGQAMTIGDVTFRFTMIPGHTAGSLGLVFPVKDGRTAHMAGLFGGSVLIPTRIPDDGLRQYIQSIDRWAAATRGMNVDVEIQNHPLYDGFEGRLLRLKQRTAGQPHPFVVGREAYQRFLQVMSGCTSVQLARRGRS